jgi:hypothetical protein
MKKSEAGINCLCTASGPRIKFREPLVRFWRDLHDDQLWKYDELAPVELLEKREVHGKTVSEDELARANWFWTRRPRVFSVVAWISWLIAVMGAWFWVTFPLVGVPILIALIALVLRTIVRSVRWRREYELSIDRLIRASGHGKAAFAYL